MHVRFILESGCFTTPIEGYSSRTLNGKSKPLVFFISKYFTGCLIIKKNFYYLFSNKINWYLRYERYEAPMYAGPVPFRRLWIGGVPPTKMFQRRKKNPFKFSGDDKTTTGPSLDGDTFAGISSKMLKLPFFKSLAHARFILDSGSFNDKKGIELAHTGKSNPLFFLTTGNCLI